MNRGLEFHDSEVESVSFSGGNLVIELSNAYIHESEGQPGISLGTGYYLAATMVLSDAKVLDFSGTQGGLTDGEIYLDGQRYGLVPVPLEAAGKVHLELTFISGLRFSADATSIRIVVRGEPTWVEPFSGQ